MRFKRLKRVKKGAVTEDVHLRPLVLYIFDGHQRLPYQKVVWLDPISISQSRRTGGDTMGAAEWGCLLLRTVDTRGECGGCGRALYHVAEGRTASCAREEAENLSDVGRKSKECRWWIEAEAKILHKRG
jgi:ribosomal protein L37E